MIVSKCTEYKIKHEVTKYEADLVTRKPEYLIRPNDRVTNELLCPIDAMDKDRQQFFADLFEKDIYLDTVLKRGGRVKIRLKSELENRKPFTRFDGLVYAAVCTLKCNPQHDCKGYMTTKMIFEAMKQKEGKVTPELRDRIDKSLERMASTRIEINYLQEMDFFDGLPDTTYKYTGNLLHMDRIEVTDNRPIRLNGEPVNVYYKIFTVPILYQYAYAKNQVAQIPFAKLETTECITIETIFIRDILERRIYAMKNSNRKLQKTITLESIYTTVFTETGLTDIDPQKEENQKRKIRKKTERVLRDFVKNDFIKGFKIIKKGRKIHSYEIEL